MAKPEQLPKVTEFSKRFGAGLRQVMSAKGITQTQVADAMERQQGYVSERLSGKRPVDTDMISAIAGIAKMAPRAVVTATFAEMKVIVAELPGEVLTARPSRVDRTRSRRADRD